MKSNVFACLAVLGGLSTWASADLYGLSSDTPGTVYSINSSTGAATPVVSLTGESFTSIVDIEFLGGVAYACDVFAGAGFSFGSIDLTTGAFTTISNQDGSANWWGLASKESAGILYTIDMNAGGVLKSVTTGGVTTTIGATGISGYGLTYDALTDTLYASDASSLYSVNQGTGVASLIGSFGGPGGGGYNDLAYDPLTDTLYLNSLDTLYTVDKATGLATLVGPNNQGTIRIDGLANLAPVPEPASIAAIGLGLTALARRRRKV